MIHEQTKDIAILEVPEQKTPEIKKNKRKEVQYFTHL